MIEQYVLSGIFFSLQLDNSSCGVQGTLRNMTCFSRYLCWIKVLFYLLRWLSQTKCNSIRGFTSIFQLLLYVSDGSWFIQIAILAYKLSVCHSLQVDIVYADCTVQKSEIGILVFWTQFDRRVQIIELVGKMVKESKFLSQVIKMRPVYLRFFWYRYFKTLLEHNSQVHRPIIALISMPVPVPQMTLRRAHGHIEAAGLTVTLFFYFPGSCTDKILSFPLFFSKADATRLEAGLYLEVTELPCLHRASLVLQFRRKSFPLRNVCTYITCPSER